MSNERGNRPTRFEEAVVLLREPFVPNRALILESVRKQEETMNFGEAIEALKAGKKVARDGWNGRDMWLCLMPGTVIPSDMVNTRTRAHGVTGDLNVGAYIVMWTAQGTWQPGWLASQADMLAEDWREVS